MTPQPLTDNGLLTVAATLKVGFPELWTVLSVETRGCGFLPDRRPQILFERHVFHRMTQGKFSAANPDISNPVPGGYANEYSRLGKAILLDRDAALQSASWGIAQVMGFHYRRCGFPDIETMVTAMQKSEDGQLAAMASFLVANQLDRPLANHDWPAFARAYNGPAFSRNKYDARLKSEYQRFTAGPLPNLTVRAAQVHLMFLSLYTGEIDGQIGPATRTAAAQFLHSQNLPISEEIDQTLLDHLTSPRGADRQVRVGPPGPTLEPLPNAPGPR